MRATLKINDVEKDFSESLSIDWLTTAMARFETTLPKPENLTAFSEVSVERDGVEIFAGVIMEPKIEFGSGGTTRPIKGFDHTIKLLDFLCPYLPLVDVTTEAALTAILTNWPYDTDFDGEFGFMADPTEYDTSCEFQRLVDYFGTCIEYKQTSERTILVDTGWAGSNELPDPEHRGCFFYDGTTERHYVFFQRSNRVYYSHSSDCGANWTRRDTGYVVAGANHFSVGWYDSKVYLFLEDAGGNTDFYRGVVVDGTGIINFALIAGNMRPSWIKSGPFFTPNGNIWVVDGALNRGYESEDDGATWNNRFTGTATLWYMLPKSDGEDMWLIEWDAGDTHLELWEWDKPGTSQNEINQIRNLGGDILEHVAGCQTADFSIRLAYSDDDDDLWFRASSVAGVWGTEQSVETSLDNAAAFHICADRYDYAYIGFNRFNDFRIAKGNETDYDAAIVIKVSVGHHVSAPAAGQWDGKYACFFSFEVFPAAPLDTWFCLLDPEGIRLDDGETTGYFVTETITASGSFIKWGLVVGTGTQTDDMSWSVLDASDDSVLVDGQLLPFDMTAAGVPSTVLSIKLRSDFTDTGIDPLLVEFGWAEFIDEVTLDLDLTEDLYTGISKLRGLSGGEFYVTKDNGGYTLHYVNERGSDKSNVVVLKNAHSSRRLDVIPNVKVVSKTPDWDSFANSIMIIGAGDAGVDRIEESLQDNPSIVIYGEKWHSEVNLDVLTDLMGLTRASVLLSEKSSVVERIVLTFLDTYEPGAIEIGDTVWVCVDFADVVEEEINEALRVIGLNRIFTPDGGESVTVTVVNQRKAVEYWDFLGRVQDLTRWSVI